MGETDTRRVALESRWPRALRRLAPLGGIGLGVIVALSGCLLWLGYRDLAPSPAPESPSVYSSLDRLLTLRPLAAGRPSRNAVPGDDRQPSAVLAFGSSDTAIEVARATVEIERAQEERGAQRDLHVHGLLRGSEGRLDEAVVLLEGAHLEEPERADVLADLAAVHLSRFVEVGEPADLFRALVAAERALALEPGSATALFNRAQALSSLHLRSQAIAAWESYLAVNTDEPWADAARWELERLWRPTLEERWEEVRSRLLEGIPMPAEAEIREAARQFPHRARMLVLQELLPRWSRAWQGGDAEVADGWLRRGREIGLALEIEAGDSMIAESTAVTERAAATSDRRILAHQAEAYELLARGIDLYYEGRHEGAVLSLRRAWNLLEVSVDPLWGLPAFFLASAAQFSDPVRSSQELLRLRREFPGDRYPQLSGFCDWVLGTLESTTGDSEKALHYFRSAQSKLARSASDYAEGPVHVLLGDAHRLLGQDEAARREYLKSLEVTARVGDRYRSHTPLYSVVEMLVERGEVEAARSPSEELVANAQAFATPHLLAEAHLQRGRVNLLLGRTRAAEEDFREARRAVREMPAGEVPSRIAATLALTEAELAIPRDPRAAIETLDLALESKLQTGYLYHLTRTLYLRGMAHLELGAVEEGRRDLLAAAGEYERLRSASEEQEHRRSTFELAQDTFEALIRLEVESGGPPERSLAIAERSRSRQIEDLLRGAGSPVGGELDGPASFELPPPGLVFLEYSVLPDRLLMWAVSYRGVSLYQQPVSRASLEHQVERLRNALSRRAPKGELQAVLATLYDLLVGPAARVLPPDAVLAVVPDRFLAKVPFAALYDQERGRYLIEKHAVTLSPAIRLYPGWRGAEGDPPEARPAPPTRALVVGDPDLDRRNFPDLEPLPGARTEALEVSRLYPDTSLLLGSDATAEAFLELAPRYEVIQFSGHARTGWAGHEESSLILSPSKQRSGAVGAVEIAALDLRGTGLVVLSACSALDADQGGRESVTGLAAAFFAAGSPAVIAALWEVGDETGPEVVTRLHRSVTHRLDPVRALQATQVAMLREADPRLSSAATWGSFVAVGGAYPPKRARAERASTPTIHSSGQEREGTEP